MLKWVEKYRIAPAVASAVLASSLAGCGGGSAKWEYKCVDERPSPSGERTFNSLGDQGWELVTGGLNGSCLKRKK